MLEEDQLECPLTLEPIPPRHLVKINKNYFDARELLRYIETNPEATNPLTREVITPEQRHLINEKTSPTFEVIIYDGRRQMGVPSIKELENRGAEKFTVLFDADSLVADLILSCGGLFEEFGQLVRLTPVSSLVIPPSDAMKPLYAVLKLPADSDQPGIISAGKCLEHSGHRIHRVDAICDAFRQSPKYIKYLPKHVHVVPDVVRTNCTIDQMAAIITRKEWCFTVSDLSVFIDCVRDCRINKKMYREAVDLIDSLPYKLHYYYKHILACLVVDKWNFSIGGCEGYHVAHRVTPPNFQIVNHMRMPILEAFDDELLLC